MSQHWGNVPVKLFCLLPAMLIALALGGTTAATAAPAEDLIKAAATGDLPTVTALLNRGEDPNPRGVVGMTPLMFASQNGYPEIVRALLQKGADINARSVHNQTALMSAALNGHRDVVQELIGKGADVNAKGNDGKTALMMAAQSGLRNIATLLIAAGADVRTTDLSGKTAQTWAAEAGNAYVFSPVLSGLDKGRNALAEKDFATAFKEFLVLAEAGDKDGQFWLAQMYGRGSGIRPDIQQYAAWLEKAAEKGHGQAQANFGLLNTGALGHPQNLVAAYMWLSLAVASGTPLADFNRNSVAAKMTPEQIAQAQQLAREWKPK